MTAELSERLTCQAASSEANSSAAANDQSTEIDVDYYCSLFPKSSQENPGKSNKFLLVRKMLVFTEPMQ